MSGPIEEQTFAERAAELERVMQTNLPTINNAIIADLLTALREGQRTILACAPLLELAAHSYRGRNDFDTSQVISDVADSARATLARWKIEEGK